jgi:hypothetical protein
MKLEDEKKPIQMIVIGFVLVMIGVILPFLMQLGVIDLTRMPGITGFLLAFLTYAASVAGLFLGFIGGAMYVKIQRDK